MNKILTKYSTTSDNAFAPMLILVIAFMFLGVLNVFNRFFIFTYIAIIIFFVYTQGEFKADKSFVALLLFGTFMLIFSPYSQDKLTSFAKPFTYCFAYVIGYNFISYGKKTSINEFINAQRLSRLIIVIMVIAPFLHLLLNAVTNSAVESTSRNTIDFWTGKAMSATGQMVLGALTVGLFAAAMFSKSGFLIKALSTVMFLVVMAYNLTLAGRTLIILAAGVLLVAFIFTCIILRNFKLFLKTLFFTALIVLAVWYAWSINAFGIEETIKNSNLYQRFFGTWKMEVYQDVRFENKLYYLSNLLRFPFGGQNISTELGDYAHGIFLDIYDEGGVFSFLPLFAYMSFAVVRFFKILAAKNFISDAKLYVLCIYSVFFVEFCIEPIFQGMPWFFVTFCFLDGINANLLKQNKKFPRRLLRR